MKKMSFIILTIFILLIVMVGIIGFIFFSNTGKNFRKLSYINDDEKIDGNTKVPINMYKVMSVYNGEVTGAVIYKSLDNFAKTVIPQYCSEVNLNSYENYYDKNSKVIYMNTGIDQKSEFKKIVDELEKVNAENLVFDSYMIMPESVEKTKESTDAVLIIKYEGNNTIAFNISVERKKSTDRTSVIYNVNTDIEPSEIEEALKSNTNTSNVQNFTPPGKVVK